MNNMYDILAKLNSVEKKTLTENAKPDFLDIDKDGDKKEPMKQAAKDMDEASYSAKSARAGHDIGKPGKNFEKIAKSAGERYGSKAAGERVAGAVLAKLRAKESVNEEDMEEGNEFSGARMAAIRAGRPTFTVDGKTYRVSGDTSQEKRMDESQIEEGYADFFDKQQMYRKIGASVEGRSDDYTVTFRDGTRKRYQDIDGRRRVTSLEPVDAPDEQDDEGNVVRRGRGRPRGTGRKMGARGQTHVREGELDEQVMTAIGQRLAKLGQVLSQVALSPEEQYRASQEYADIRKQLDTALGKAKADVADRHVKEQDMDERELTKPELKKREEIVRSMKKDKAGFEKRYGDRGEAVMYATATKQAKKSAEESQDKEEEQVEETTTSGSVAVGGGDNRPKGIFGQGVYETYDQQVEQAMNEGMNISASQGEDGGKSLTITATDDDAVKLAHILKLAGMDSTGYQEACPTCGQSPCGCEESLEEGDLANSPEQQTFDTATMINDLSGGLNGRKNTGQTTGAPVNKDPGRQGIWHQANFAESRAQDLWQQYKGSGK